MVGVCRFRPRQYWRVLLANAQWPSGCEQAILAVYTCSGAPDRSSAVSAVQEDKKESPSAVSSACPARLSERSAPSGASAPIPASVSASSRRLPGALRSSRVSPAPHMQVI